MPKRIAILLAALTVVAARPYEDTKGRFRITLAEKWELMPQFGDMAGMTFRRVLKTPRGEAPAILLVHMDSVQAPDAKAYADAVEDELKVQPGFSRLDEKPAMVGGKPALLREYKLLASKKPKIEKRIRSYFLETGGHVYELHFESTSQEFRRVEKDVEDMIATFVPLGGSVEKEKRDAAIEPLAPRSISGRWINADKLVLVLGDDGSFALAEASGRYEVKGDQLTMIIPGQGRESFSFVHDAGAGTLTLSSANLGEPMVYRRISGATTAQKEKSTDKTETSEKLSAKALLGRWSTSTPSGPLVLDLRHDRGFTMGSMQGTWSVTGEHLVLKHGASESIDYRVRLDGGRLFLSGGDLDEEVGFGRYEGP
jgi:hypothetical protein